jgi:Transposase DDE domain.
VEGEEGLSKNTLRRKYQKADLIYVTSEKVHDGKVLRRLVRGAMKSVKVRRVLADGAYDSRENFNFLSQSGIKPVIRVRVNSVARSMGCPSRRDAELEQRALGPRAWSKVHRFGFRCVVEGVFSVVKRGFSECLLGSLLT